MDAKTDDKSGKCPFTGGARGHTNRDWWPDALDVSVLHRNSLLSDPMGEAFDYAKEFKSLDLNAVIKDLHGPVETWGHPELLRTPCRMMRAEISNNTGEGGVETVLVWTVPSLNDNRCESPLAAITA
jgi:hypothetical protein